MKTEASPRPWRVRFNAPCVIDPNGDDIRKAPIARTDCSHGLGDAGERDKANAELIVRSVNSFDALVEALEDMLSGWCYIRHFHGDLYGVVWDRAQTKAEAALKLAKGEQ